MFTGSALVVTIVIFAGVAMIAGFAIWSYLKYRGTRVVTCPETGRTVAVELDAMHATLTSAVGAPDLRLTDCTRWPERQNCGQDCLAQIEESPEDCLARVMLTRWYEERKCAFCGKPFGTINWADHRPALMDTEGITREWREIPAETLPRVLKTYEPVCWNCHIAESFRREHPELVIERPRHRAG